MGDLAESIRCYALGNVKHGHLVWTTVLGCLLRDLFPDPESALYLTGLDQAEFVQGFSTFILESLVGTEPHPAAISHARTREELLRCLRYWRSSGTLSEAPPARVELLEEMLSPWASVTYGGCRYLRVARAETVRKIRGVNDYYKVHKEEKLAASILDARSPRSRSTTSCSTSPWSNACSSLGLSSRPSLFEAGRTSLITLNRSLIYGQEPRWTIGSVGLTAITEECARARWNG